MGAPHLRSHINGGDNKANSTLVSGAERSAFPSGCSVLFTLSRARVLSAVRASRNHVLDGQRIETPNLGGKRMCYGSRSAQQVGKHWKLGTRIMKGCWNEIVVG
jgi:hypothetical protein